MYMSTSMYVCVPQTNTHWMFSLCAVNVRTYVNKTEQYTSGKHIGGLVVVIKDELAPISIVFDVICVILRLESIN